MRTALIVGHLGQDGRLLTEQLTRRGFEVAGLSRREFRTTDGQKRPPVNLSDYQIVRHTIEQVAPEQIFYLAAQHSSSTQTETTSQSEWSACWNTHVHQFQSILEATIQLDLKCAIFYASSSRIFGSNSGMLDERSLRSPECAYGVTKCAAMLMANQYRIQHDVCVSSGILFNHESHLRSSAFLSQRVVQGLLNIEQRKSERLTIGNLDARVDWGYAPDFVDAFQSILERAPPGDYVVATGICHTVRDFIEIAAAELGLDWQKCVVESNDLLKRPAQGLRGDASKLRLATGWRPSLEFEEMVKLLVKEARGCTSPLSTPFS